MLVRVEYFEDAHIHCQYNGFQAMRSEENAADRSFKPDKMQCFPHDNKLRCGTLDTKSVSSKSLREIWKLLE